MVRRSERKRVEVNWSPFLKEPIQGRITKEQQIYEYCTRRTNQAEGEECVVEMYDYYLTRVECQSLGPKKWISTAVMSMVAKVMVGEQLHEGKVRRYIFDSEFMATLRDKKLRWSVFEDAKMLMPDQLGYNLGNCDYLFLPMLVFNHWFCYCADLKNDKFFILDSLAGKLFKEKKMMAGFMRTSIIELLQACDPEKYGEDFQMEMIFKELPKQSNVDDCGVYVIKYCTEWDGRRRKGGLTMEDFSNEQLRQFRVDMVWWLVNHMRNEVRNEVFASVSAANRPKRAKECR
ncbi:ubiquitin-like-specific protease 1A [Prosopis cineraria]|uniref:ubiquitin-like-specific protease 1A n=1 Tax=Prosopis cineraria TaxID=364024 RepID=UPI00240EE661|nr:ubiquitin-like-specific protease 1A [Prosopis cineraria]